MGTYVVGITSRTEITIAKTNPRRSYPWTLINDPLDEWKHGILRRKETSSETTSDSLNNIK